MRLLLEQPVRMLAETRGIAALAASSDWLTRFEWGFTPSGEVRVDFDISLLDKVHEAVLVYPDLFPQAPAYVRPRSPDEAWSAHQYSAGTLCLEWGPDNWHPEVTGSDLVTSTHKLLAYEKLGPVIGIEAPSRHELTPGQRARGHICRFVVTTELVTAVASLQDTSFVPLTTSTTCRFSEMVALATKLGGETAPTLPGVPAELADSRTLGVWVRNGWVIFCEEWVSLPQPAASQTAVRDFLKAKSRWPWPDDEDRSGFILLVDKKLKFRPLSLSKGEGRTASDYFVVDGQDYIHERQPAQHQKLSSKKIAIVGVGSVGSKLAVSLARSGVSQFLLVDDDILKPANLARNQLDWLSVGYSKVEAVKGAIQLVNPHAEIQCKGLRLAGQESSSFNTAVLEQIAACDLVIDATASPKVFSSLAAICTRRKVALVWGEVFAGGIGALMARSLPGLDAEPLDVRGAIHQYLSRLPEAPFRNAQGYDTDVEQGVLTAGDAEVSQLAASMTQFSIDALTGRCDATGYRFPVAAYLMGYQLAWAFDAPFDTHAIECPPASSGPTLPEDAEKNVSAFGELVEVFRDKQC